MNAFSEGQNRYSLIPLFLVGVSFVLLSPVFWLNSGVPQGGKAVQGGEHADLYDRVFPVCHYGFSQLQEGQMALWNPTQWCGTPFMANPTTGLLQPLNVVFLLVKTEQALAVQGFLSLFLMGLFFVVFARSLGAGYTPAFAGGMVYAFGGASAVALAHPEILPVLAWAPLAFWAVRECSRTGRYGVGVVGGVVVALMIVGTSPPAAAAMLCVLFAYAVFRVVAGEAPFRRRLTGMLLLPLIGALVSAVQWVPMLAWLSHLDHPLSALNPYELAGQFATKLREIPLQMLTAAPDVLPRPGYVGTATLLLAPLAFFQRPARFEAFFFAVVAAGLLCAAVIGGAFLASDVPGTVLVFPAALGISVLAALGTHRLFMAGRDSLSPLVWIPPMLVLVAAVGLFIAASASVRGRLIPLAVVVLFFLMMRLRPIGVLCAVLTALLLFVDLYAAGVRYYPQPLTAPSPILENHARLFRAAAEQSLTGRVLVNTHPSDKQLTANMGMIAPLRSAGGSRWPLTHNQAQWWAALNEGKAGEVLPQAKQPELLNYMGVRVLIAAEEPFVPEGWETRGVRLRPARGDTGLYMYINESALPRCYWAPGWRAASGMDDTLKILGEAGFDGRHICVVDPASEAFAQLAMLVPNGAAATPVDAACTIQEETPERVTIRVDAPQPGVAVLADSFDEGWIATLNGKPVPILRTNGLFRGVATPAGGHTIVFTYRPLVYWLGLAASLGTLIGLVLLGIVGLSRKRHAR